MRVVRNLLMTYGACALSARVVGLFTGGLTYPLSLRGQPGLNPGSAMVVSTAAACLAAALAGVWAGITVETMSPGRWSVALGALVWFEYGGDFRPHVVIEFANGRPSLLYLVVTGFAAATIAVLFFHLARTLVGRWRVARAA